ncbi:MAG: D-mannonate epimerase, partial [Spirochaetales bacterium]|nr:D-mannonate epimerase [Spirochaetales bacterium]
KVVVYLSPDEFRSTWLGNKSIYRTRMAIADGGELIVMAPGVHCFGENQDMDLLIRKFGYKGTPYVMDCVDSRPDMAENLSVAAHLIHGSSEGRFTITYCPGKLSREEVEDAGFAYGELSEYETKYPRARLAEGWNTMDDGEEIYYISNPALGLWALKSNFPESE